MYLISASNNTNQTQKQTCKKRKEKRINKVDATLFKIVPEKLCEYGRCFNKQDLCIGCT